ncbi:MULTISPECIES: DUF6382 domain-containing protein [Bacillaceae]|uniref:FHA domain-containing protein n=1 Tax=Evansella alkalicola TaxID=745819 RepID=A0ABS6K288_9BACI|nr:MULTISPECIES: DUF6382 domain-containing protein [Bacillaceae]MBU9724259.1 FHA domain-containing protein [Bacillus alkalicola]
MNQTIYQLQYDFEQQNGNYLVLFQNGENQIHSNDLAKIQVKMLLANPVENLLPLEVEEMDFNVKFYYNFGSKKMLSHVLRETKLTIHQYYTLLFNIVTALEKSKEYMLTEQNYILNENFIFVEGDVTDVHLIYLPMNQVPEKPSIVDELRNLVINLMSHIKELQGDGVQNILAYLSDPNFKLDELKSKLDALRNQSPAKSQGMPASQQVQRQAVQSQTPPVQPQQPQVNVQQPTTASAKPAPQPGANQGGAEEGRKAPHPALKKKKRPQQQQNIDAGANKPNQGSPKKKQAAPVKKQPVNKVTSTGNAAGSEPKKPSKIVVFALMIIAIAVSWKLFEMNPVEGMLYISSGLSLLAMTGAYYFLTVHGQKNVGSIVDGEDGLEEESVQQPAKKKKPLKRKQQQEAATTPPAQAPNYLDQGNAINEPIQRQQPAQPQQPVQQPVQQQAVQQQQTAAAVNEDSYFDNLQNQTMLMSEPEQEADATMVLDESPVDAAPNTPIPYLEVVKNGATEKVKLNQSPFIVGRNPESVNYIETIAGISRIHCEFEISDGKVALRDLGSKNGTELNGEKLVPYKLHLLNDGDQIKLGKANYTFKMG